MEDALIFAGLALIALAGGFFIQFLLIRRAISQVIQAFCRYDALGVRNAKTADEMELKPPDLIHRLTRPRDYKPYALQLLQQAGIVHMTGDGRFYLTEEKLNESMRCRVVWQPIRS